MNTIRIVAAVVDLTQLTMYKEDGTTVAIPQGDPRLRLILEEAAPQLEAQGWADVTVEAAEDNSYADFEGQSSVVKFFRIAKAKLKSLVKDTVRPQYIGIVPASPTAPAAPATPVSVATATDDQAETFEPVVQVPETKVTQTMSVVDEIIAHATPVTSEKFNETNLVKQRPMVVGGTTSNDHPDESAEDTIVAVVDGKIIPGMELIKSQFARAAMMGSTEGVERFLQRLSTVIESRGHSVEDLLKFMERADLPIADDGTIIIYKILRRKKEKTYVDCHSGNVEQWIGAYVCMDPSLVDHNRSNECSNGLHVARRGYINNFSGDVCVLAKLAPEDVITVPKYDANKMRVCGYHILSELPPSLYQLLKQNKPITSEPAGKTLLAMAMCGKHIRKTHEVRITGSYGGGVQVKEFSAQEAPEPILTPNAPVEVESLADHHEQTDTPINPAQLAEVGEAVLTRKEQAKELYDNWNNSPTGVSKDAALAELIEFKRVSKVSWERLGIEYPLWATIPTKTNERTVANKDFVKVVKEVKAKPAPAKVALPEASDGSARERIERLLSLGLNSKDVAQKVYNIKKAAKKSWDNLGVSEETAQFIMKKLNKD